MLVEKDRSSSTVRMLFLILGLIYLLVMLLTVFQMTRLFIYLRRAKKCEGSLIVYEHTLVLLIALFRGALLVLRSQPDTLEDMSVYMHAILTMAPFPLLMLAFTLLIFTW